MKGTPAVTRPCALRLAAAVVALLAVTAAPAPAAEIDGLHDTRYCEILVLDGTPPDATVTVWNTIGSNRCPAAWWNALEAGALARELGASLVVLNGPRHWLIDAASGETGGTRRFHGQRLTKVATIPIRSAADLARTPYTDRTIARRNTWRWNRGRTVFELVAPGGDVYVMQAYAQIVDPSLRRADLRRLGRRLQLPEGWRYRVRRLREPLVLTARGQATILQDELQNTYQLAKRARPRGPRTSHGLRITGRTRLIESPPPGMIEDHGTVSGRPFGNGTAVLVGSLAGGRLAATVRLLFDDGEVRGTVDMPFTITDGRIAFRGTVRLTGGTGAYRGITSGALQAVGSNTLDGQNGRQSWSGSARY
jgi:hypothetical protein